MALRYLFLNAHYRTSQNFSWEALASAQTAFLRLRAYVDVTANGGKIPIKYRTRILERLNDDLDTPGALALVWEMMKDPDLDPVDMRAGIIEADRVLGLGLDNPDERARTMYGVLFGERLSEDAVPREVADLISRRKAARKSRRFEDADALRQEIEILGFTLEDAADGLRIYKRS